MGNVIKESACCRYLRKDNLEMISSDSITSKSSIKRIITIQRYYRGYHYRKKNNFLIGKREFSNLDKNAFNKERLPGKDLGEGYELDESMLHVKTRELMKRVPPFELSEKELCLLKIGHLRKYNFEFSDKSVYKGYFNKDWQKEGFGVLYFPDGGMYEGFFRGNLMDGRGRLINQEGFLYEGEFTNNKANGYGKYISIEGVTYKGQWKDEKQHGYGEEDFVDGSRYEGEYFMGKKNGKGKFKWPDGYFYEGEFFNNDIHGYGTYRWKDGRIYQGQWIHNKMNGTGIFIWPDKKKYIGSYKNDVKEGYGIFYWPDGRKYEGCWAEGKQHGFGIFTHPIEGKKYGEWHYGKKIRSLEDDSDEIKTIVGEIRKKKIESKFDELEKHIFSTEKSIK